MFDEEEQGADVSTVSTIEVISQQLNPLEPEMLAKVSSKDSIISAIMRYVKQGWPHRTNSKDVLQYKRLEDSRHTSQTQEPGTATGTPGALWDAADEATGPLSGILVTY